MSLMQLVNTAHAVLCEDLDEDGVRTLDASLMGKQRPHETQEEAFLRARSRRPARGAPSTSFTRNPQEDTAPAGPPPMPPGIPLAPAGVQVREPTPTRGLEVLDHAFGRAPRPTKAVAARKAKKD